MITLGLVDSVDANGVYVTMPGSRGLLRGPYKALSTVAAGTTVLVASTDDGEQVVVGTSPGGDGGYNVRSFGAVGDGVTDDSDAVELATAAAAGAGGFVFFPPGTYLVGPLSFGSDVDWRGVGAESVITFGSISTGIQSTGTASNYWSFEGLHFTDGPSNIVIYVQQSSVRRLALRRVSMGEPGTAVAPSTGLNVSGGVDVEITDCRFEHPNDNANRHKVSVTADGPARIRIAGSTFTTCGRAVQVHRTTHVGADVEIANCVFDGMWHYMTAVKTNSGATVSYAESSATESTITDTAGGFTALSLPYFSIVRVLPVLYAGTMTVSSSGSIVDASATFVTDAVQEGDLVRTSDRWAAVVRVNSETSLTLEPWRLISTNAATTVPSGSVSYTVYRMVMAQVIETVSDTVLKVRFFRDMSGVTLSAPSAGTLYEVAGVSNYQGIHVSGARRLLVTGCQFKRVWADAISTYGVVDSTVTGNQFWRNQDMSITHTAIDENTERTTLTLTGNTFSLCGASAVYIGAVYGATEAPYIRAVVSGNVVSGHSLVARSGVDHQPAVRVVDADGGVSICGNVFVAGASPGADHAVGVGGQSTNVRIDDNVTVGYSGDEIYLSGSGTQVSGRFQDDTSVTVASSANGPLGDFGGAGAPSVIASVGSTYRRTDGGAGTSLYVKEADPTASTGWVGK